MPRHKFLFANSAQFNQNYKIISMIPNRFFYGVLLFSLVVCITGMIYIPLMDIDAAQYALISREMLVRNSFLQVFENGKDFWNLRLGLPYTINVVRNYFCLFNLSVHYTLLSKNYSTTQRYGLSNISGFLLNNT